MFLVGNVSVNRGLKKIKMGSVKDVMSILGNVFWIALKIAGRIRSVLFVKGKNMKNWIIFGSFWCVDYVFVFLVFFCLDQLGFL